MICLMYKKDKKSTLTFHYFDTFLEPIEIQRSTTFEPMLFNEVEFLKLRQPTGVRSFIATNSDGVIIARLRFVLVDDIWMSLPFCPFGGVECIEDYDIEAFLSFSMQRFGSEEKIKLVEAPFFYRNHDLPLESVGWNKYCSEINHHINLQEPIIIKSMQLRRLKKCRDAGFVFKKVNPDAFNAKVWHSFIEVCRQQQGLQININYDDFAMAIASLPDKYDFFGVWDGSKLIAATVVVHVTSKAVYNYLPASTKDYHQYSPMVMLMLEVVDYFKKAGVAYFDLGVSSINGKAQQGLCAFKESMGGIRSEKKYYELRN
jgi:hypothetical protein